MVEPVINCPYCKKEIKLTESLAAPLIDVCLHFDSPLGRKRIDSLLFDARRQHRLPLIPLQP